jgi:hypothetical protein
MGRDASPVARVLLHEGNIDKLPGSAHEAYTRLAGEVEARNAQHRMNMTPEQRRANPPWRTQDLPDEQQIVRRR